MQGVLHPCAAQQNRAVQFFQRPAVFHHAGREPVEQFRLDRRFAPRAEVTGRRHESRTEMMQPHAIRDDARGERIFPRSDGLREFQPAAALREGLRVAAEKGGEPPGHHFAGAAGIAADEHMRSDRLGPVAKDVRARRSAGLEFGGDQLRLNLAALIDRLARDEAARDEALDDFRRKGNPDSDRDLHDGADMARDFLIGRAEFGDRFRALCFVGGVAFSTGQQREFRGIGIFFARCENPGERIVILRGDRVELVIVAPRAADGERHRAAQDDIEAVVNDVILVVEKTAAQREEAERGDVPRFSAGAGHVAGDLAREELIVRHVLIQRTDDPVAIRPRKRILAALAAREVAAVVGIARHVEPVASPALAVTRRSEQAIDHFRKGIAGRRGIFFKDGNLFARGRQAREIECRAADERVARSERRWRDALAFELRKDKPIDLIRRPMRSILHGRHRRFADRLEGPVRADDLRLRGRRCFVVLRPRHTHLHPFGERRDVGIGELRRFFRHHVFRLVADAFDERAFRRIADDDDRPAVGSLQHRLARIEPQIALLLFRAVAFVAMLREHGPHALFKKFHLILCGCRAGCG